MPTRALQTGLPEPRPPEYTDSFGFAKRLARAERSNLSAMRKVAGILKEATANGVNKDQFKCFRANYLLRTCTTPLSVAAVVSEALRQRPPAIQVAQRVANEALMDELGPLKGPSHIDLLVACMNTIGKGVFRTAPVSVQTLHRQRPLLAEAEAYDQHQMEVFSSGDYPQMLGALYGREKAAVKMLEIIQEHLFEPLTVKLKIPSQRIVRRYFDVHLTDDDKGREAEHARAARANLDEHLLDRRSGEAVCAGAERTLRLQSNFFLAVAQRLLELKTAGVSVGGH